DCPNQDVVDKLQELQGLHRVKTAQDDHWRTYSYSRSIPHIRAYKTRIKSYAEARKIPRVGHRTAMKIMEIINSGELQRIKFERTPDVQAMKLFEGIYGVGPTTGLRWYMNGLRTLDDVRNEKNGIKLTPAQRIGVEFYDDINERMPREEVQALFDLIKPRVLNIDPRLVVQVMGSFRRGKADCGDIDILITRPTDDGKTHRGAFLLLLSYFIVTEDLAMPDDGDGDEGIYRGLCRLPKEGSKRRRIDFLVVPWESRGAALIYYTGDDIFNRAMRFKAGNMGYSLNQHGLFAGVVRDPRNRQNKLNEGNVIASATEEEIFRILGVPWQEPHQRVRSNIS
ncbi:Nucleotidyltransferase, partial [Fistulina hepatica ATCC 64428]